MGRFPRHPSPHALTDRAPERDGLPHGKPVGADDPRARDLLDGDCRTESVAPHAMAGELPVSARVPYVSYRNEDALTERDRPARECADIVASGVRLLSVLAEIDASDLVGNRYP